MAAAVHIRADRAFVNRGERKLRLRRRHESGEPRRGALLLLRSPLRGAGFAGDLDVRRRSPGARCRFGAFTTSTIASCNCSIVDGDMLSVRFSRT